VTRLWAHMRSLWPRWTLLPVLPYVVYVSVLAVIGDARWDHVVLVSLIALIAYGNARTKKLYLGAHPFALVAIFYDVMRYMKGLGVSPERVHDCDLRAHELALFGIGSGADRITLSDYFLTHHWTALDLYCAVPYGTFIFAALGAGVVLYFRDYRAMQRFSWVFFLMNVAAFVTYHLYPAAPPWYYHAHGCEISMTALPSAGPRLTHVDAVLGIHYFKGIYERSSDLYGAVPSLHVAYPLVILVEGWRSFRWLGRSLSVLFLVSMGFSAIYLDHHWVIDVVLGMIYCLSAAAGVRFIMARAASRALDAEPPALEPQA
jgi:inositol phosphorylceramide synthase catalytic subunit